MPVSWEWTAADIAEITFTGRLYNQLTMTVLHYRPSLLLNAAGEDAADELKNILIAVGQQWDSYKGVISSEWQATRISIQRVHEIRQRAFVYLNTDFGTQANAAGTANVQASITKFTELSTPKKALHKEGQIGRVAVPGVPQGAYNAGVIPAGVYLTALTLLAGKLQAVLTTASGNQWTPVLWHRNGTTKVSDDVFGCIPQTTVRVSRRRTVGVGK